MKTAKQFLIFLLLVTAAQYAAATTRPGPRETITKKFELKNFNRLQIGSAFTITVSRGEAFAVTATGEREKVEDMTATVKNDELVIAFKENKGRLRVGENTVRVDIVMPALRAVNFSGTSSSLVKEGFEEGNFVAYVSGTAKSEIHVRAKEIFTDVSGTASLELFGTADNLKANVSGASGLNAFTVPVQNATLDVSGTSGARVNVSETINVRSSGASTVRYKGAAKAGTMEVARLSSFKKVE